MEPTRYLDRGLTLNQNLELIAQGAKVTKHASIEEKNYSSRHFILLRDLAATITSFALTIFSYQAGLMLAVPIAFAGLTIYAALKLKATVNDKSSACEKFVRQELNVTDCYNNLILYINKYKSDKEKYIKACIKESFESKNLTNENFSSVFQNSINTYKAVQIPVEHLITIRNTQKTAIPPKMIDEVWKKFIDACDEFVTCNGLFNSLATQYNIKPILPLT